MGLICTVTTIGQPYDLTLNNAETGTQLHQATNSITLAAGYSYIPGGGTMLAEIVSQAISGNTTYSTAIDPASYTINTGLAVGKTSGNLAVGGSAAYSIPIEIPAGTNGLQPTVSLNYSSGYSDGFMGMGWSLGGISAITRTTKTIYNDSKSDAIRGDSTDKYSLDGKRLVTLSGSTYGADNSVYGTELEEFSKIVAHGATGQGPDYFVVFAKSGLIYEYGNTTDSKLKNGTCILSWKLNKITDRYNNYIRFSYVTTDNELPIEKIEYTGNGTSQIPFAQILFHYKTRADISSYIYGGKEFTRNVLLDNIEVRNKGLVFKKYGLDYMRDTYAQLQKVTEYSSQNISLNPTVFAWTDQTELFTQAPNYSSTTDDLLFTGDFNGDGREDLVTVPNKTSYLATDQWKLYLADASGNLNTVMATGYLNTAFETFMVNDFNGDGLTDLMMQEKHPDATYPNKKYYYFYQSSGTNFSRNTSYYICNDNSTLDVVDYNGDGMLDLLYHTSSGSWSLYSYAGTLITSGSIPSFGTSEFISDDKIKTRILDYNGDGASDILALFDTGYKVYEFKGTNNELVETSSGTNIFALDTILAFGDFNGDGNTDIITGISSVNGSCLLNMGNQGFISHQLTCFNNFDIHDYNNRVYARDMDGDGKTDVVFVGKGTNTSNSYNRINIALSTGSSFNFNPEYVATNSMYYGGQYFNFGDFKGDGRYQLLYKNIGTSNLFSFASGTPSHLVSMVIDGLGAKAALTYLPMSNSSVYTRGTGAAYPVSDFSSSMQLVSQVSSDNGIGGNNSVTYTYAGAKVHHEGKGFLGFAKMITTDITAGLLTETQSGYNTTYYYPQVNTVTKKTTGATTIETSTNTWTQSVLDATNKRIFPYVSSTTQTNWLTGHSVTITTSSVDSYGNPIQVSKSYNWGVTETTVNNYSDWINTTDWLVGRIGSSTITYSKSGETSVSQAVRYTYSTDGTVKPDFIYYYEGSPLEYYKNHDYDSKGNLTQVYTSGASIGASQSNYTYDSNGIHVLTSTDALGHTTTRAYDPSYDWLLTEKDYLENVTTYQYDTSDRLYTVLNPVGSQITTTYVWTGTNIPTLGVYGIIQTGNDGSMATTWYDKLGRAIRSEKKGFGGSMILTDTEYNAKGQVYRVSDPQFAPVTTPVWAETYTTYDDYGRITAINRNTGRNTSYAYSANRVTETTAGKTSWKDYESQGLVIAAHDNGGDITYTYYPDGKVKNITAPGGITTSMQYADAARNQTQLVDPSAGTINYTYDSFGRVKTQTDARGQLTTHTYLADGRTDNVVNPEGTTTYSYNTNKQLTGISSPNSVSRTYGYDTKGRVNSISETIAGSSFPTTFTYDTYGRLSTRTHPSTIVETMNYNSNGYLWYISAGGTTQYTITGMNARQQLTTATYGSNLTTTYGFDAYGYPSSTATGLVQDYRYVFEGSTGNLTSRQNFLRSKSESFTYDNLDRLLTATGPQNLTMTYNYSGNINTKSDIDTTAFGYGANAGPYALTAVTSSTGVIPSTSQTATYNSFEKVNTLTEGVYSAAFIYNSDRQRAKMDVTQSSTNILTRWYAGSSYMKEDSAGVIKQYTYLGGDAYSAPVVAVTQSGATTYYYLLRDYLGNITHQVNTSNTVVAEYNFDAWGRRRSADDWSYTLDANDLALFADRGFTSHEYLSWFNLYNMNGRLYDPLVGRFLNSDPYVQDPGNTQSYNRYSYCLNNPLRYTDPSGYTWWSHFTNWVGENKAAILTGAYLVGAAVVTVFCPVAGMAMFGAYLGGMSANNGKINMGSWNWKDSSTYWGIGIGGLMGGLGGQMLAGAGGVFAGGTTLDVSLSATLQNAGAVFAHINIGAAGISLADVGYATVAGGGAIITGAAIKSLFNKHGIDGAYPTNKNSSSWDNVTYTDKGRPGTLSDMVNSNGNYFNTSPTASEAVFWISTAIAGWAFGAYNYQTVTGYDPETGEKTDTIPTQAPTTTDKTPQFNQRK
jgi:RHS repeat-associated protein